MVTDNDAYQEFLTELEQRMEFTLSDPDDPDSDYRWKCGRGSDPFGISKEIAVDLGMPFDGLLATFATVGAAHCDCEVIFNCDTREDAE